MNHISRRRWLLWPWWALMVLAAYLLGPIPLQYGISLPALLEGKPTIVFFQLTYSWKNRSDVSTHASVREMIPKYDKTAIIMESGQRIRLSDDQVLVWDSTRSSPALIVDRTAVDATGTPRYLSFFHSTEEVTGKSTDRSGIRFVNGRFELNERPTSWDEFYSASPKFQLVEYDSPARETALGEVFYCNHWTLDQTSRRILTVDSESFKEDLISQFSLRDFDSLDHSIAQWDAPRGCRPLIVDKQVFCLNLTGTMIDIRSVENGMIESSIPIIGIEDRRLKLVGALPLFGRILLLGTDHLYSYPYTDLAGEPRNIHRTRSVNTLAHCDSKTGLCVVNGLESDDRLRVVDVVTGIELWHPYVRLSAERTSLTSSNDGSKSYLAVHEKQGQVNVFDARTGGFLARYHQSLLHRWGFRLIAFAAVAWIVLFVTSQSASNLTRAIEWSVVVLSVLVCWYWNQLFWSRDRAIANSSPLIDSLMQSTIPYGIIVSGWIAFCIWSVFGRSTPVWKRALLLATIFVASMMLWLFVARATDRIKWSDGFFLQVLPAATITLGTVMFGLLVRAFGIVITRNESEIVARWPQKQIVLLCIGNALSLGCLAILGLGLANEYQESRSVVPSLFLSVPVSVWAMLSSHRLRYRILLLLICVITSVGMIFGGSANPIEGFFGISPSSYSSSHTSLVLPVLVLTIASAVSTIFATLRLDGFRFTSC